jgi:hypothetical protein
MSMAEDRSGIIHVHPNIPATLGRKGGK